MRLKRGDHVIVHKSPFSDIPVGTVGLIDQEMPAGFAVDITGLFSNARHEKVSETRRVYFKASEIRRATGFEGEVNSLA
jgi:hypothetical protein